uniref:MULE transposase domain-containing protein n=1 Tax=Lactuca sativa TaxID=4236 RepID=A0A9R1UXM8_LACSA|nr:hypothetical protein LSAT_V11C800433300 [Lactuca sativa]
MAVLQEIVARRRHDHVTQKMQKTKFSSLMKIHRLILISVKNNHMLHMITFLLVAPFTSKYDSYDEAATMYRNCALESGFDVRLGRILWTFNIIRLKEGKIYLGGIEIFIHNLSKQNIGPVKAHRLYTVLQGGPWIRGGLVSDFKNARRNLDCYIGGRDAKFLVDKMNNMKKIVPAFTFEYKEIAKYNYNSFGDVVSLDVTFSMNNKEDGVSYEWLLRDFLKAFRKQHKLVIFGQDLALKKAIDNVFWLANHRLCMCHITKKLSNKLEPHDFENIWHMMSEEFKITNNNWMKTIFWIPAFFKHVPMSGLMRTTSLSESQNWSFQTTTLTGSYLIIYMMTFDSVMERQRHNQILNDFNTTTTFPKFITCSPNEPHGSKRYQDLKIIVSKPRVF